MDRRQIIDALNRLAFAGEILDDSRVDPKALAGGAWNLRSLDVDLAELHKTGELQKLRTVNKSIKGMVASLLDDGEIPLLAELEQQIPEGLFGIRKVKGLGPKKVRALWRELDISSLAELEQACTENRLVDLKGFGQKTQEKVLAGVRQVRAYTGLARLDVATTLARDLRRRLLAVPSVREVAIVGDVRRGKEIASEVSVLVLADPPLTMTDSLRAQFSAAILNADDAGDAGANDAEKDDDAEAAGLDVTALSEREPMARLETVLDAMRVTVFVVDSLHAFAVAHLSTSASEGFLAAMVDRAASRGFTLDRTRLLDAQGAPVALEAEDEVFEALDLWPTPPERREDAGVLVERGQARPTLLRREDLTGALHNHTVASDGGATLEQMRDEAIALGLRWLGISEHSQSAVYARGLEASRLAVQGDQVRALNLDDKGAQCQILHGVESDILPDGSLDYDDTTLQTLSHVIASVHARGRLDRDGFTARMVRAAEHPWTDVIGHPTGRLLLGRPPSDFDTDALLDACARCGTALELNASPARLDLGEELLAQAKARGILVSISADAHSVRALSHLEYGVTIARRAGLTPDDVLNARPLADVQAWFSARKARAAAQLAS